MKPIKYYSMLQQTANIAREIWGTIDNKQAFMFTITNNNGSVFRFSNYGCIAQSLLLKNRHGVLTDVLLGYNELKSYKEDPYYMGGVVGRCANRVAGGPVKIGTESVLLTQNRPGFHHHGGFEGFNKKLWDVVEEGRSNVKFYYESRDGEEGYPGSLEVWVNYVFTDDDTWIVEYEAKTDKATLINLTQHAYFNLKGHSAGSVEDHELSINSQQYLPVNELQMPTGEMREVQGTAFDFNLRKTIGRSIDDLDEQLMLSKGFDHTWVLEKKCSGRLKHAATVRSAVSALQLNVFTTEPSIHLYTANFLETKMGKDRTTYKRRSGLCLETQHFPDAPNQDGFPSTVLEPGQIFKSKTVFQFSMI